MSCGRRTVARVPILAVQTSGEAGVDVPYVLPTDVVVCPPGAGFPVDEIARRARGAARRARRAARGPGAGAPRSGLRPPDRELLAQERDPRRRDLRARGRFPVLTLNQLRLVLRLAAAHGVELDQSRLPEVLATIGAGLGFRAVARQLLGVVPVAGWAVKGGIAYAGTRAVGEAARRYFACVPARRSQRDPRRGGQWAIALLRQGGRDRQRRPEPASPFRGVVRAPERLTSICCGGRSDP